MRFLHTMLRVRNLDAALQFYCNLLGLEEVRRRVDDKNRYTLVFLAAPEDVPAAKQALESDDVGEIRAKTEALTESSHKLAEAVYAQATASQATSSAQAGNGSTSDDEVVEEADYEVIDEEAAQRD